MSQCPRCGQERPSGSPCGFCPARPTYSSATHAVERFFGLCGRSSLPAQDPSRIGCRGGGARPPVPAWQHERALLGAALTQALGVGWETGSAHWRALGAVYGAYQRWGVVQGADELCREALTWIRNELVVRGLMEGSEQMAKRDELIRGWREISDYLEISPTTVQRWYSGPPENDLCNIRQVVTKVGRLVVARRSDLDVCWERLYPVRTKTD